MRTWIVSVLLLSAVLVQAEVLPPRPATQAEVNAGTDKIHPVTPLTLANASVVVPGAGDVTKAGNNDMTGVNTYSGTTTFSNTVSVVGGTIGLVATKSIVVTNTSTTANTAMTNGNITSSGTITATAFAGDISACTGLSGSGGTGYSLTVCELNESSGGFGASSRYYIGCGGIKGISATTPFHSWKVPKTGHIRGWHLKFVTTGVSQVCPSAINIVMTNLTAHTTTGTGSTVQPNASSTPFDSATTSDQSFAVTAGDEVVLCGDTGVSVDVAVTCVGEVFGDDQ